MDISRSADIIPFPAPVRLADPALEEDPRLRLQKALAALEAAVATQRDAVATWRTTLGTLGGSVRTLHSSLVDYRAKLEGIGAQVDGINQNARALESWADAALAVQSPSKALNSAVDKAVSI